MIDCASNSVELRVDLTKMFVTCDPCDPCDGCYECDECDVLMLRFCFRFEELNEA